MPLFYKSWIILGCNAEKTDIKLELKIDIDMCQFTETGMRGGVSYIANHYGKTSNKYT